VIDYTEGNVHLSKSLLAIMQCRSTEKNKKLSYRKQISRQHSCHKKNGQEMGCGRPCKFSTHL